MEVIEFNMSRSMIKDRKGAEIPAKDPLPIVDLTNISVNQKIIKCKHMHPDSQLINKININHGWPAEGPEPTLGRANISH